MKEAVHAIVPRSSFFVVYSKILLVIKMNKNTVG